MHFLLPGESGGHTRGEGGGGGAGPAERGDDAEWHRALHPTSYLKGPRSLKRSVQERGPIKHLLTEKVSRKTKAEVTFTCSCTTCQPDPDAPRGPSEPSPPSSLSGPGSNPTSECRQLVNLTLPFHSFILIVGFFKTPRILERGGGRENLLARSSVSSGNSAK